MKKMITVGVAALAVALPVASATAGSKPDHPASAKDAAAKQCKAEKKADKAAFKATYGKHAMRTCIKGETPEGRHGAEERRQGVQGGALRRSRTRSPRPGATARTPTASASPATVRAENKSDVKEFKNAAKECKAARSDDADAFATAWGDGKNAFGKCVSATAKAADERVVIEA